MLIDSALGDDGVPHLIFEPVTEDDKVLYCVDIDKEEIIWTKDHIPHAIPNLYKMHMFCFVCQLLALVWK